MAVLDDHGKETGAVLQGEKGDISIGGISSIVRLSSKKTVRLLLGRKVLVSLLTGASGSQLASGMSGLVVAIYVHTQPGGESSLNVQHAVHVQFDRPLQDAELAAVARGN
jgi:hypothetical protein